MKKTPAFFTDVRKLIKEKNEIKLKIKKLQEIIYNPQSLNDKVCEKEKK